MAQNDSKAWAQNRRKRVTLYKAKRNKQRRYGNKGNNYKARESEAQERAGLLFIAANDPNISTSQEG